MSDQQAAPERTTRILLFTGKGGVGKTTCAAATALRAAERGYRTLILSSDPAHSLADALDRKLGPEPVTIRPNLDAQEIDLYYSMKKYWSNMRELMLLVLKMQGVGRIAAEELAALPGMGEASAMLWLDQCYHSGAYDLIIIDSAPTGETLTFLTLPQVTEWWISRALPFQKVAIRTFGAAVRTVSGIPLDKGYNELQHLFSRLKVMHEVLSDPAVSSMRLVLNPEKMVIREARRAYTYLQLYGYGVDAVVVNRILPEAQAEESGWQKYVEAQQRYMTEIHESFSPLPILQVPHLQQEVFGIELLRHIADALYADRDPREVFFKEQVFRVEEVGEGYRLALKLPFVTEDDFTVERFGDQLVVQIANQRRHYLLPQFLSLYKQTSTELEGAWLHVHFEKLDD